MGKRNADYDIQYESPCKKVKYEADQSPSAIHDFVLTKELVEGTIMTDLCQKHWKVGKPIGKGSFGEIFLASDDITRSVTNDNAKYVVKIEPHSNGPLFVEIHCLLNIGKPTEDEELPPGMPEYIASGSHYIKNIKYRFLILPRYNYDLHSIIKNRRVDQKNILVIAGQLLDVLEHIHDKGYAHSDIKAENILIGNCTYTKSVCIENETETVSSDDDDQEYDDCSLGYTTPPPTLRRMKRIIVEYSGSNPVRSCRMTRKNSTYQDMLSSHYLRPSKKINYCDSDDELETPYNKDNTDDDEDDDEADSYLNLKLSPKNTHGYDTNETKLIKVKEDRIYLVDYGLASKFVDLMGVHRPFCMDQRRAHDGTLEFTSRDAHMGAHSRRSDLECLGYNLIYWSQGSLPWKDDQLMSQPEQVHCMKEYFMTEVKKVLKDIYGESVPIYLGEFMEYVGSLAYHDRPNYKHCKDIFARELSMMGFNPSDTSIDLIELKKKPIRKLKEGMENNNVKFKDVKVMIKLGLIEPFKENGTNRISPKNLRSKSDKIPKKQRKKFSWTEILSTDPDQIARKRAEKEFQRDQTDTPQFARYKGKATYAILEVENKIKFKDKLENKDEFDKYDEYNIKGYTKPMMDIFRKRQLMLLSQYDSKKKKIGGGSHGVNDEKERTPRRKPGLRNYIIPTEKNIFYRSSMVKKKRNGNSEFTPTDESSCSSAVSEESIRTKGNRRYNSSCGMSSPDSDDSSRYSPVKVKSNKKSYIKKKVYKKKLQNGKVNKKLPRDEPIKQLRIFTRG